MRRTEGGRIGAAPLLRCTEKGSGDEVNEEGEGLAVSGTGSNRWDDAVAAVRFDVLLMSRRASTLTRSLAREMRSRPTQAETAAWEMLRGRRCLGLKFRRQYPVRGFVVDFYCPALMLAIELDGSVHDGVAGVARDAERSAALSAESIDVVRIRNEDLSAEYLIQRLAPFLPRRRWS